MLHFKIQQSDVIMVHWKFTERFWNPFTLPNLVMMFDIYTPYNHKTKTK